MSFKTKFFKINMTQYIITFHHKMMTMLLNFNCTCQWQSSVLQRFAVLLHFFYQSFTGIIFKNGLKHIYSVQNISNKSTTDATLIYSSNFGLLICVPITTAATHKAEELRCSFPHSCSRSFPGSHLGQMCPEQLFRACVLWCEIGTSVATLMGI